MFRRYSGKGNSSPGVLIVTTSVPVLGVSPSAGVTGACVGAGASRSGGVGAGGFGAGLGGAFGGGLGLGFTGAGFSCGGVGIASRAIRRRSVGAGAATRFTEYTGGVAVVVRTWPIRNSAAPACTTSVPIHPASLLRGSRRSGGRTFTTTLPPARRGLRSPPQQPG